MIEYRHSENEGGMNGSKDRFSVCSVGTFMLFTTKFSGFATEFTVRSVVLTEVFIKIQVFWDVLPH
jgi:hypothetical protein